MKRKFVCCERQVTYRNTRNRKTLEGWDDDNKIMGPPESMVLAELFLRNKPHEEFWVFALSSTNKWLGACVGSGNRNQVYIFMRNIFHFLFDMGATQFFLAHNHPAGTPEPSHQDIKVTNKIVRLAKDLELKCVDHIIVVDHGRSVSFSERGLM